MAFADDFRRINGTRHQSVFGNGFYGSKETCLLEKITRMRREIFIRRDRGKKEKKGHGGKFFVG